MLEHFPNMWKDWIQSPVLQKKKKEYKEEKWGKKREREGGWEEGGKVNEREGNG